MELKRHIFFGAIVILFAYSEEITISSNGNTPVRKMISIDRKSIEVGGFVPIIPYKQAQKGSVTNEKYSTTERNYLNNSKLPVNERYRRLIPYMTFYLANDFNNPQTESYSPKDQQRVTVPSNGKLATAHYNSIPRYQGNRLSHFNIASAYPNKILQDFYPQKPINNNNKYNQNQQYYSQNHQAPMQGIMQPPPKQNYQFDYQPIPVPVKYNQLNYYKSTEPPQAHLQYYVNPETARPKPQQFKLVPYEQTPPLQIPDPIDNEDYFVPKVNPYTVKSVQAPVQEKNNYQQQYYQQPISDEEYYNRNEQKEQNEVYSYSPATQEQNGRINQNSQSNQFSYQPVKNYSFKKPSNNFVNPVTESGFKPMVNKGISTQQPKLVYVASTSKPYTPIETDNQYYDDYDVSTQKPKVQYKARPTKRPVAYTEYPEEYADVSPNLNYESQKQDTHEENNLAKILKTLQNSHSLPQTLTTDNIDSSIKTLVQILNNLKNNPNYVSSSPAPVISSPRPFKVAAKPQSNKDQNYVDRPRYSSKIRPGSNTVAVPIRKPVPTHEYPPQDLEKDHPRIQGLGSHQDYLAEENELGGTPGKPGKDYPILSVIPPTRFDCKTQRYKGFFGDPETNCQVWHYCDLNGGQASFLCPNGTIFSQVALTCDWWFNVKCDSTAQLYVLNERLYKFILPYTPKFPEDYSGPLVDKYLTIKYKELEEKMQKQKKGKQKEEEEEVEDDENDETDSSKETSSEMETVKAEIIEINPSGMSGAIMPMT